MKKSIWILLFLSGCAVGPNYRAPENEVSDTWTAETENISSEEPLSKWWEQFDDFLLSKYIERAAEYNKDVQAATSTVLQARALRKMDASAFYPQVTADVNATKTYFSKNGPIFEIGPSTGNAADTSSSTTGLPFSLQVPQKQNLFNVLFDASWEIDLFGKTRRKVEAADATIAQTMDQKNDIMITVMAEVARNYMELRSAQQLHTLIAENIAFLEEKAALIYIMLRSGYVSRLDEENIQAMLAGEKAKLPDITARIYRSSYAISVLIGEVPETLVEALLPHQSLPKIPECIAVGLKSDLLRRRPDIRAAERALAAATANIGVATAEFFPTFTILGEGGLQSLLFKNLFSANSKTWAYGGDLSLPIFQGGRLRGNLQLKKAEQVTAGYRYQQIVLKALEESEGALITYTNDLKTIQDTREMSRRYRELTSLSNIRYAKGLINYLNVLDSKRQYNESEQSLLNSDVKALLDLVTLYKVLGGGW